MAPTLTGLAQKRNDIRYYYKNSLFFNLLRLVVNDKSHQHKSRKGRNKFIAEAFGSAHMPLQFIAARRTYNVERSRELLGLYVISGKVSPLPVIEKA